MSLWIAVGLKDTRLKSESFLFQSLVVRQARVYRPRTTGNGTENEIAPPKGVDHVRHPAGSRTAVRVRAEHDTVNTNMLTGSRHCPRPGFSGVSFPGRQSFLHDS
ncbi:hypothetical protein GCM10011324_45040 [Allosediminivita pacifica]|nr:hypothetical protein GCM10011324_45040 [Allosediminivita pacifica]